MIERQIVIGLVVSTEYLQQVRPVWEARFLKIGSFQQIGKWCVEYFDHYNEAPGRNIEQIYFGKLEAKEIEKDLAEDIEDDLHNLSDEYEESFNLQYILTQTNKYFKERGLILHAEKIQELIDEGEQEEAQTLASNFKGLSVEISNDLDLSGSKVLLRVENAFLSLSQSVVSYPGALGEFWNEQMVRGAFVGLMAREKLGKTFLLLDMAMRAVRQRSNIAFFQAGDMTEDQQLKRICIYLTKKPTSEKNCGDVYFPVVDCIRNQLDTCDKEERECDFGPLSAESKLTEKNIRKKIKFEQLKNLFEEEPDYKTCRNCKEFHYKPLGMPWLNKTHIKSPLGVNEAKRKVDEFFVTKKRRFRMSTHANGSLTLSKINQILDRWEREDGFIADGILVDYADLLVDEGSRDFRQQQNNIWRGLRGLSQDRNALVVAPTQADSRSYTQYTLNLSNFSEDKRKYAHVTAMYGLNQDPRGREKRLGVMRINEMVIREGDFAPSTIVTLLQSLNLGRPFLGSYW